MEILLGEGESLIQTRNYSGGKGPYSLTVTNKRLIHVDSQKNGGSRKDFALKDITGVEVSVHRNPVSVLLIILGILFLGAAVGLSFLLAYLGAIAVLGLVCIIAAIFSKRAGAFTLIVYLIGEPLCLAGWVSNKYKENNKKLQVVLDEKSCRDIAANLGKIIFGDLR